MNLDVTDQPAAPVTRVRGLIESYRQRQRALPAPLRLHWLAVVTVLLFLAIAAWSVSTPVWGSPDEQQHAIRAYGVAHGQLVVQDSTSRSGKVIGGFTQVPAGWRNSLKSIRCFAFRKNVPASCMPKLTNDRAPFNQASTAAHYDPLFYGLVGAPTRVLPPARDLIAMRLVSALLCAICLAWGLTAAALAKRPMLATAIALVAVTPMVFFLAAMVNPNGLEICAALATWTCLYWTFDPPSRVARTVLLRRAGLAASAMVVTRSLSPLWLFVIVITLLVLVSPKQLRQSIDWQLARWAALVMAVSLFAVGWILTQRANDTGTLARPHHYSLILRLRLSWGWWPRERHMTFGQVGNFGWLDTPLPNRSLYPTAVVVFVAVGAALLVGKWRERLALAGLLIGVVALPVVINAMSWNSTGSVWQPRYTMPLSIGLVALSGTILAQRLPVKFAALALPAALAAVGVMFWTQLSAISIAMSRYIVGLSHPVTLTGGYWQPPHGALTWFGLELASLLMLTIVLGLITLNPGRAPNPRPASAT